jgi:hypothetical protein
MSLDFPLLYDMGRHLSDLNTKFQSQQKLISDMFGAVRVFDMKLTIFQKELEDINL